MDDPDLVEYPDACERRRIRVLQIEIEQWARGGGDRDQPGRADESSNEDLPVAKQVATTGLVDPRGGMTAEVQDDPIRLALDRLRGLGIGRGRLRDGRRCRRRGAESTDGCVAAVTLRSSEPEALDRGIERSMER